MSKTVIIIPCYNEASRLPVEEFQQGFKDNPEVHFLFVNDGSTDNTLSILNSLKEGNINVDVFDSQPNSGKANAVRIAMIHALEHFEFDLIGYFDADLATPLNQISEFETCFSANKDLKMVVGCRVRRLGADINRTWKRHIIGRVFATFASATLMLPVYDTQCGAKMICKETIENLFSEKFISKWLFDVEVFARLSLLVGFPNIKKAVYEHPLQVWIEKGDSRIKLKDFIKFPIDLLKIHRKYHSVLKKQIKNSDKTSYEK